MSLAGRGSHGLSAPSDEAERKASDELRLQRRQPRTPLPIGPFLHLLDKHCLDYTHQVNKSHPARVFRAAQPLEFSCDPANQSSAPVCWPAPSWKHRYWQLFQTAKKKKKQNYFFPMTLPPPHISLTLLISPADDSFFNGKIDHWFSRFWPEFFCFCFWVAFRCHRPVQLTFIPIDTID